MDDIQPRIYNYVRSKPGYIGNGLKFLLSTSWVYQNARDYLFDEQCIIPLLCSAVGIVAEEGLQVEPHGDFLPPYGFHNAHIRFTLQCPSRIYPGLRSDYHKGILSMHDLVDSLCDKPDTSKVIGIDNGGLPTLIFAHKLFKRKAGEPRDSPDDARFLPVSEQYRQYLEPLYGKYALNILPTFNEFDHTSFWSVKDIIKGAVVRVEFYLYYEPDLGLQAKVARIQLLKAGTAQP